MKQGANLMMGLMMLALVSIISQNLAGIFERARQQETVTEEEDANAPVMEKKVYTVVLDAGHGGQDGGKVSVDGYLEKDVNMAIVQALKADLEAADVRVVLTRTDGNGLYQEGDSNKKRADMNKRCAIIETAEADVVVSIHQNSYPDEDVSGPQVFYYTSSDKGQQLAQSIQDSFDGLLGADNNRTIKANSDYYLLKNVSVPIVIVECGFLSNPEEAEKLENADYQQRVAWTIHMGILEYLNTANNAGQEQ
jgi:N-acetylmuramoyl-L-alanine amidase